MESFLRRRDLPSFCRNAKTTSDRGLRSADNATANTRRARALILNTFESLEGPVLSHIRSAIPITYALGPLHLLVKTFKNDGSFVTINSVRLSQEDRSCMTWLDSQPPRSVVYVSFGSVAVMSREELMEFWHGLVDSGQRFLWVLRSDLVEGKTGEAIPAGVEGTRERVCIVGWAPQEQVLSHPAVGCFLTHSGWNSTLESVAAGVPMICWPCFADQQINSRFVSDVWRIGADMHEGQMREKHCGENGEGRDGRGEGRAAEDVGNGDGGAFEEERSQRRVVLQGLLEFGRTHQSH